jgi:hypothetical protein
MNKTFTTRHLPATVSRSLTLILMLLVTANGQQKPTAIWADVDLSKGGTTKATKTVQPTQPTALDPEKRKSIWREPAWYVALGGSALDLAGSVATIDGKHLREGNPLLRGSNGKVALTRALPVAAISLFAQYHSYKNPKYRKLAIASMLISGIVQGVFGGARGFAMR